MADNLANQNIEIRVTQGLRSYQEQDALYAQGRTTPGRIVTNARGGESWHNFGMAVDVAPSLNGVDQIFVPDWNENHPVWMIVVSAGTLVGLVNGKSWKDEPHFELVGQYPVGAPTDEIRQEYEMAGVDGVWELVVPSSGAAVDLDGEISV